MKITAADLDALRVNLSLAFNEAFSGTPAWWNRIAMYNRTVEKIGRMGWLANLPQMRELVGDRVMQNFAERSWDIVNRDRDLSVAIHRDQLETSVMGSWSQYFRAMGETAAKYPDQLLVQLMQAGNTSLCFDGQFFFDTDHPVSLSNSALGIYSNFESSGRALTFDNYGIVRAAMIGRRGENGLTLGVVPNLLVVPPQLEATARLIVGADFLPSTAGTSPQTNIWKNTAEVLMLPELSNEPTAWYLIDARRTVKPFVYQERRSAMFDLIGMDSEHFKKKNEILIIGDASSAVGYALPQLAYKAVA